MRFDSEEHRRVLSLATQTYIGTLVHDLRTPLNGVIGLSCMLLELPMDTATRLRQLEMVQRSAQHMLCIVNEILEAGRINGAGAPAAPQATCLVDVLDDVAAMTSAQARQAQVELCLGIDDQVARRVLVDRRCLTRILCNLVANAIDFAPRGRVEVWIAPAEQAPEPSLPAQLRITVRDTGLGMFSDELLHLFEPGFQGAAGAARGGNGLGLAICKALVERLGGTITVHSQPGQGSCFEVLLALTRAAVDHTGSN